MNMTSEERREARRRKILENSESRLNKILNRTSTTEEKVETLERTRLAASCSVNSDPVSTCRLAAAIDNCIDSNDDTVESSSLKFQGGKSSISFDYLRKYFAILAVLVYLILSKGGNNIPSKTILTPFATLSIVKQSLVFRHTTPTTSIYLQMLILYGVNARLLLMFSRVLNAVYDLLQDFCIYFFTFVIMHVITEILLS